MKKWLAIIAGAVVFGALAAGTFMGANKLNQMLNSHVNETQAQSETEESAKETESGLDKSSNDNIIEGAGETKNEQASEQTQENKQEKQAAAEANNSAGGVSGITALDVSGLVEDTMPEVVSITNVMLIKQRGYGSLFDYFYGGGTMQEYEVPASGSGVIIQKNNDELLIVTNNHVIEDSKELSVTFIDGETVKASLKGTDSIMDVAVIAVPLKDIKEETQGKIKTAKLHDNQDLKVGQGVVAIGNALGFGQSVTVGFISALEREITAEDGTISNLIQVDAAINPGNSGGALLNMKGELIGINVAKMAETAVEGVGYAIPIYKAVNVIENLVQAKTRVEIPEEKQGRLGVYINTINAQQSAAFGIPAGCIVVGFSDEEMEGYEGQQQESPLRKAGLMKGDIITKFDNQVVGTSEELTRLVKYYEGGTTVSITYQRLINGEYAEMKADVTLGFVKDTLSNPSDALKNDKEKEKEIKPIDPGKSEQENESKAGGDDAPKETQPQDNEWSYDDEFYDLFRDFMDQYR